MSIDYIRWRYVDRLKDKCKTYTTMAGVPSVLVCAMFSLAVGWGQTLSIDSVPNGASVQINGRFVGHTPVTVQITASVGFPVSVRVEKERYEPYDLHTFWPGKSSSLTATLKPANAPETLTRLITERVILSAPKTPSSKNRVLGQSEEPPENGTEFLYPTAKRGAGTIRITNELDADAFVELLLPRGIQFRAIYIGHNMEAAITEIPPGAYVVAYTVGSGWQKRRLLNVVGSGNIGTLEFTQVESARGIIRADHYRLHLTK